MNLMNGSKLTWEFKNTHKKSSLPIHKLRNHKLPTNTSIPIKTVHSKHELIDLINSIDDNQYLMIDMLALIVCIHALLFLVLILISPQLLIKLLNFSLLLLLMIPLCINSLVSYAKIFPVMFFLIALHHSPRDFSHIDSLLSKSKHLKLLSHPLLHHKLHRDDL